MREPGSRQNENPGAEDRLDSRNECTGPRVLLLPVQEEEGGSPLFFSSKKKFVEKRDDKLAEILRLEATN